MLHWGPDSLPVSFYAKKQPVKVLNHNVSWVYIKTIFTKLIMLFKEQSRVQFSVVHLGRHLFVYLYLQIVVQISPHGCNFSYRHANSPQTAFPKVPDFALAYCLMVSIRTRMIKLHVASVVVPTQTLQTP